MTNLVGLTAGGVAALEFPTVVIFVLEGDCDRSCSAALLGLADLLGLAIPDLLGLAKASRHRACKRKKEDTTALTQLIDHGLPHSRLKRERVKQEQLDNVHEELLD